MSSKDENPPDPPTTEGEAAPAGEEKVSVITVNFKEGAIVNKVQFAGEGGIPKFLRDMAKFARQDKVKSVIVMTINEENHVDWVHIADSEYHLALAALCLDDIRDDLKSFIFDDNEETTE